MKIVKLIAFISLLLLTSINLVNHFFVRHPLAEAQITSYSLSQGDRYIKRLNLWYLYAKSGLWNQALALESQLDPQDFQAYKNSHYPPELKKYINTLILKPDKNIEDWIELARVENILGKTTDAQNSITKARSLDPIRDDLSQIYYQLNSVKP